MRTGDGGSDEQRRIDGVKQLSAFEDAESHGRRAAEGVSKSCANPVFARSLPHGCISSRCRLRMYTEKGIRHVFMVRDGRTAESQRHEGVQVGDKAERELFFCARFIRQQDPAAPRNNVGWQHVRVQGLANPEQF